MSLPPSPSHRWICLIPLWACWSSHLPGWYLHLWAKMKKRNMWHFQVLLSEKRGWDWEEYPRIMLWHMRWHRNNETLVDCTWNVMAHAQKPDLIFRRNGWVHLNWRGASVQSTTGSWGVRIAGSNAGYTMFWGTDYPLHLPVSPSLPLPCTTVCHHISTGLYKFNKICPCIHHYGIQWQWRYSSTLALGAGKWLTSIPGCLPLARTEIGDWVGPKASLELFKKAYTSA